MLQQQMLNVVASCTSYLLYLIRYVKNIFITKYFLLLYFWASYLFSKDDITKRYFDFIFYARTILSKKQVKHQLPFILIFHRINTIVSINTMLKLPFSELRQKHFENFHIVILIVYHLLLQRWWKGWAATCFLSEIFTWIVAWQLKTIMGEFGSVYHPLKSHQRQFLSLVMSKVL